MTNERADMVIIELGKVQKHKRDASARFWDAVRLSNMTMNEHEAKRLRDIDSALDRLDRAIDAAVMEIHGSRADISAKAKRTIID